MTLGDILTMVNDDLPGALPTDDYKVVTTLTAHSSAVYTLAISPDGKQLISGSNDDTIIMMTKARSNIIG